MIDKASHRTEAGRLVRSNPTIRPFHIPQICHRLSRGVAELCPMRIEGMSNYAVNWMNFFPLPPTLKSVLRAIADQHYDTTGDCHPSQRDLENLTGFCRATIKTSIRKLEEMGLLTRSIRTCPITGATAGTHFSLHFNRGYKADPGGAKRSPREGTARRQREGSGDSPTNIRSDSTVIGSVDGAVSAARAGQKNVTENSQADFAKTVEHPVDVRPLSVHDDLRSEAREARNRKAAKRWQAREKIKHPEAEQLIFEAIERMPEQQQRHAHFDELMLEQEAQQEKAQQEARSDDHDHGLKQEIAAARIIVQHPEWLTTPRGSSPDEHWNRVAPQLRTACEAEGVDFDLVAARMAANRKARSQAAPETHAEPDPQPAHEDAAGSSLEPEPVKVDRNREENIRWWSKRATDQRRDLTPERFVTWLRELPEVARDYLPEWCLS